MKFRNYFLALLLIISVYGCAGPIAVETQENVSFTGFDFTEYSKNGFLFTPNQYDGEYESVGIIKAKLTPEMKKTPPMGRLQSKSGDNLIVVNGQIYFVMNFLGQSWYVKDFETKNVIKNLYDLTSKMGADAVTNLKIEYYPFYNGNITTYGVEVSGFAIKRKPVNVKIVEDKK